MVHFFFFFFLEGRTQCLGPLAWNDSSSFRSTKLPAPRQSNQAPPAKRPSVLLLRSGGCRGSHYDGSRATRSTPTAGQAVAIISSPEILQSTRTPRVHINVTAHSTCATALTTTRPGLLIAQRHSKKGNIPARFRLRTRSAIHCKHLYCVCARLADTCLERAHYTQKVWMCLSF